MSKNKNRYEKHHRRERFNQAQLNAEQQAPPIEEVPAVEEAAPVEEVVTVEAMFPEGAPVEEPVVALGEELGERLSLEEVIVEPVAAVEEPVTTENQNGSDSIGKFKVTSIRAHVYVEPNVATRPITAVVRGNLLPFFGKEPMSMFCEVEVLNRRQEKVRGFIETLRGKVLS